jgi:hypothetical protein
MPDLGVAMLRLGVQTSHSGIQMEQSDAQMEQPDIPMAHLGVQVLNSDAQMLQPGVRMEQPDAGFGQKTAGFPNLPMKIIYFDANPPFRLDDPNNRWGSPSYQLEPGDPGYVDPFPSVNKPTKHKKMKTNPFWPSRQSEQIIWLVNYLTKLPGYATALGLTTTQVNSAVADCLWLIYLLQNWLPETRSWVKSCTDALAEAQTGTGSAAQVLPVFTPPPLPGAATPVPATVAVAPGAQMRILALAQQIKDSGKCTDTIASNLGLVGSAQTGPDLTAISPDIALSLVAGQVFLKWGWGGYSRYLDSCEIQVDRGDGHGFVLLTIDTTPGYTDTTPLPATLAKWTYRAIYRVGDDQVGVWSAPASINVPA